MNKKNTLKFIADNYTTNDNVFPKPMEDRDFINIICDYILGENWYTVNPVSEKQVNVYRAISIVDKVKGASK